MHKTTNKKRYETPSLIIAEVECASLMAQSQTEMPEGVVGGNANNETIPTTPGVIVDPLAKGASLWDEEW